MQALAESGALKHEAKRHQIRSLKLTMVLTDSAGKRTTVTLQIKNS